MFKLIVKKEKDAKQKGITLIALIVTIIILIILAGITIATLTGEDGLINNANNAKEETEIANEKEIVDRATINTMGNNKRGNIVKDELQNELDKITKAGDTEVEDTGEEFNVVFTQTQRYYTVNKDGDIIEEGKIIVDKSPGDITKDENGNDIEEGQPYEIWCIEDLCAFSNMVNSGSYFFYNETVMLMQNLNFNSKYSYVNGRITIDGNIKSYNSIEELQKKLTTNEGFYPIGDGKKTTSNFRGIFDGNNKSINNIYINRTDMSVGLFGRSTIRDNNIIIKNLNISGNMTGGDWVGSIFGEVRVEDNNNKSLYIKIENCINNVKMKGENCVGGIVGISNASSSGKVIISNCVNNSEINGENNVGGIIGHNYNDIKVINCYNIGNISGKTDIGGIIGLDGRKSSVINSYNIGDIKANTNAGGIQGWVGWFERNVENCYNTGEIQGNVAGGIIGGQNISNDLLITKNCYYLNKNISKGVGSWNSNNELLEDIKGITETEIKSKEILEKFNKYVEETKEKEGIELKKWINSKEGYLTFK